MSFNGLDFNGDGKSDYVDYKIYTTYIDPNSGEYQGSSTSSGSSGSLIVWGLIAFVVLAIISYVGNFISQEWAFCGQFIYALALIVAFRWRGFDRKHFPVERPYNTILAAVTAVVLGLIFYRIYYFRSQDSTVSGFNIYYLEFYLANFIGAIMLIIGFIKSKPVHTIIGMALFSERLLESVANAIINNYFFSYVPSFIAMTLSLTAYFFIMAAFKNPQKKTYSILVIIFTVLRFGISAFLFKSFRSIPLEMVLFCTMAIFFLNRANRFQLQAEEKKKEQ